MFVNKEDTMSVTLRNGSHPNTPILASCKPIGNLKEEKKPLETGELQALIDVMPEMRKVEEVLDLFYNKLHEDDKLPQFTNFFSQIMATILMLSSFKIAKANHNNYLTSTEN